MIRKIYPSLFMLLFAFACGDDEPSANDRINTAVSDYIDSTNILSQKYCECYADIEHDGDVSACVRDHTVTPLLATSCTQEVAECYVDDLTVYLRCVTNAADEFRGCISSCPPPNIPPAKECVNALQFQENDCEANRPVDIGIGMEACEAGAEFSCGN